MTEKSRNLKLREGVLAEIAKLENIEITYITSCVFIPMKSNVPTNIKVSGKRALQLACMDLITSKAVDEYLGYTTDKEGFPAADWLIDCKTRADQLRRNEKLRELRPLAKEVLDILNDNELGNIKHDSFAAKLAALQG